MEENNVKKSNNLIVIIIAIIVSFAVGSLTTWCIMNNNNKSDDKKTTETKTDTKTKNDKKDLKDDVETGESTTDVTENEQKEDTPTSTEKEDYYLYTAKLKDANGNLLSFVKIYSNKDNVITSYDLSMANGVYDFSKSINAASFAESLHKIGYVCDSANGEYGCKLKEYDNLLSFVKYNTDSNGNASDIDFSKANGIININNYKDAQELVNVLNANGYVCDQVINS